MRTLTLKSLEVQRILDIEGIRLDFHPRLTALTGKNSQGKTLICGAAMLALLGLKELGSTHWKEKITSKNLARRGWKGGSASLQVLLRQDPHTFTYHRRTQSPHEVEAPDGKVDGKETLLQFGVDLGAIGFLTTRERWPAWKIVDGDSGDTTAILKNSLETRLSARVAGCEGVRKVVEGEINAVGEQVESLEADIGAIKDGWVEKRALDPAERGQTLSAHMMAQRLDRLESLKALLEGMEGADSRLQSLTELQGKLDEIADLADLCETRASQKTLLQQVQNQANALTELDAQKLGRNLSCSATAPADVQNAIEKSNARSRDLCAELLELNKLGAKPASLAKLADEKSGHEDQRKKLERARSLQEKRGQGTVVSCTLYRGETLLVELDKSFASQVSFDELNKAEVVVPYSATEEEQVGLIAAALGKAQAAAGKLHEALETAKGSLTNSLAGLGLTITKLQTKLETVIPQLRKITCPEENMPDSETGARLSIAAEWLRDQIALATNQQQGKSGELNVLLSADGMRGWKSPVQERQSPASGEQPSVLDALKEAIQSVKEHKKRFGELLERRENSNRLQDRYRKSLEVLDNYLHKIRFKDEILEQLIQTFLDFVRRGKDTFDFPFEIDEQSDGRLTIRSQYLEGPIQTGGGETQVLGILEMLAIARQFGLPVFLDEIGSYLHLDNLRKILEFLIEHTEVQAVLTTADEGFLQHLEEWGIPHRGYVVTKNPEGFTQLRPHKSRAPATS